MVALHKDVNSVAQGRTVYVVSMSERGLFQQAAPLSVLAHALVLQPAWCMAQMTEQTRKYTPFPTVQFLIAWAQWLSNPSEQLN